MPTLARLPNASLTMYAADHLPPHFRMRMRMNNGREARVEVATLTVLTGSVPKRELAAALAWAEASRAWLHAEWKELNP